MKNTEQAMQELPDDRKVTRETFITAMRTAFNQGYESAAKDEPALSNPYLGDPLVFHLLRNKWDCGYMTRRREMGQ